MTDQKPKDKPTEKKTPEEERLIQAESELSALTPEGYLQMLDYIKNLEEQLPEAGGVAWTTLVGKEGGKFNLTCRAPTPILAAERLFSAAKDMKERHGFSVEGTIHEAPPAPPPISAPPMPTGAPPVYDPNEPPMPPQPQYVDPQTQVPVQPGPPVGNEALNTGLTVYKVTAVAHVKTTSGEGDYIRAKSPPGTMFSKFGAAAYEEVIPQGIQYKLWPVQKFYDQVPPQMAYMTVEEYESKGKKSFKVVAFSEHQ